MPQCYKAELEKKIVRLREEGRTNKNITDEYSVAKASIAKWCTQFSKECTQQAQDNPDAPNELELMKENLF